MKDYVDAPGIVEVHTTGSDLGEDLFDFQKRSSKMLDKDLCTKDPRTAKQTFFSCLLCSCKLTSVQTLDAHVVGMNHVRRVMESKSSKEKTVEADRRETFVDTLEYRLRQEDSTPALGLDFVTEYLSAHSPRDCPMYTCSLSGCKSAWGDAANMFHHICGKSAKHARNYLFHVMNEHAALAMTRNEIWARCGLLDAEQRRTAGGRKRAAGRVCVDHDVYVELRSRPDNWSEAEAGVTRETSKTGRTSSDLEKAELMLAGLDHLHTQLEINLEAIHAGNERLRNVTARGVKRCRTVVAAFGKSANARLVESEFADIKDTLRRLEKTCKSARLEIS